MTQDPRLAQFDQLVEKKYNVYNSLFLSLPYGKASNIGILLPLLFRNCKEGLENAKSSQQIIDDFFADHTKITDEKIKIDFMFRVIQYVERQVVLFDSVEDAAFPALNQLGEYVNIADFFSLVGDDNNRQKIIDKLTTFGVRIVFTAHPTQFYPPAVLDIISSLRKYISRNELDKIDKSLQQLGLTSLINSSSPTPLKEAQNIIYYLRNIYYDAIGDLYSHIKTIIKDEHFKNDNLLRLGFWPGGDRDGNPYVTAATTTQVADELRMTLMKCYYNDVKALSKKLTFKKVSILLEPLRNELYKSMFDEDYILSTSTLLNTLREIRHILIQNYNGLYLDKLEMLIDKISIFKSHFASLDIRQDHNKHKQVVTELLKHNKLISNDLEELSEEDLLHILLEQDIDTTGFKSDDLVIMDTLNNISQLKSIQDKNGEEGCNRYIISNSEDIYSVLFVLALFRWSGWDKNSITFDIIPLFETMKGMEASREIMQHLFNLPYYSDHLSGRLNRQTMMLGFSDGTKDGGYFKANWSIYKTKENLTKVCQKNGVKAIFFDGRGGPPARGGGKTHRFYASQGKNISNEEIQLTIQGQTITSTYGTKELFFHNCEQMLTAGLSNSIANDNEEISDASRSLLEEISDLSFVKYDALKNHELFIPYLESMSTLKYYGKAKIGSRPGKRGNKKKLELTDLRAISFVGSWSQLKQNIPGYFGIGTAIQKIKNEGRIEEVKFLFREEPFFKALILNSMMSLSKSYFELTSYMAENETFKDFWKILYEEYRLSIDRVLEVSDYKELMEEEPISKRSVELREQIVLPLLVIQQYALQKIGIQSTYTEDYEVMVTRSLYGNINASRNSA